jgi:serine/threonine protein kinase
VTTSAAECAPKAVSVSTANGVLSTPRGCSAVPGEGGILSEQKSVRQLNFQGNAFFRELRFDEAVRVYTHCLCFDTQYLSALRNRAHAYLALGNYAAAIADCDAVLRLEAGNVKALYRRATARAALMVQEPAQRGLALQDLGAVLAAEPGHSRAKQLHAKVCAAGSQSPTHVAGLQLAPSETVIARHCAVPPGTTEVVARPTHGDSKTTARLESAGHEIVIPALAGFEAVAIKDSPKQSANPFSLKSAQSAMAHSSPSAPGNDSIPTPPPPGPFVRRVNHPPLQEAVPTNVDLASVAQDGVILADTPTRQLPKAALTVSAVPGRSSLTQNTHSRYPNNVEGSYLPNSVFFVSTAREKRGAEHRSEFGGIMSRRLPAQLGAAGAFSTDNRATTARTAATAAAKASGEVCPRRAENARPRTVATAEERDRYQTATEETAGRLREDRAAVAVARPPLVRKVEDSRQTGAEQQRAEEDGKQTIAGNKTEKRPEELRGPAATSRAQEGEQSKPQQHQQKSISVEKAEGEAAADELRVQREAAEARGRANERAREVEKARLREIAAAQERATQQAVREAQDDKLRQDREAAQATATAQTATNAHLARLREDMEPRSTQQAVRDAEEDRLREAAVAPERTRQRATSEAESARVCKEVWSKQDAAFEAEEARVKESCAKATARICGETEVCVARMGERRQATEATARQPVPPRYSPACALERPHLTAAIERTPTLLLTQQHYTTVRRRSDLPPPAHHERTEGDETAGIVYRYRLQYAPNTRNEQVDSAGNSVEVFAPPLRGHRTTLIQRRSVKGWSSTEQHWGRAVYDLESAMGLRLRELDRWQRVDMDNAAERAPLERKLNAMTAELRSLTTTGSVAHVRRDSAPEESNTGFPCGDSLLNMYSSAWVTFDVFACDVVDALAACYSRGNVAETFVRDVMLPIFRATRSYVEDTILSKQQRMVQLFGPAAQITHRDSGDVAWQFFLSTQQTKTAAEVIALSDAAVQKLFESADGLSKAVGVMRVLRYAGSKAGRFTRGMTITEVVRRFLLLHTYAMLSDPRCYLHPTPGTRLAFSEKHCIEVLSPGVKRYGRIKAGDTVEVVMCGLYFVDPAAPDAFPVVPMMVRRLLAHKNVVQASFTKTGAEMAPNALAALQMTWQSVGTRRPVVPMSAPAPALPPGTRAGSVTAVSDTVVLPLGRETAVGFAEFGHPSDVQRTAAAAVVVNQPLLRDGKQQPGVGEAQAKLQTSHCAEKPQSREQNLQCAAAVSLQQRAVRDAEGARIHGECVAAAAVADGSAKQVKEERQVNQPREDPHATLLRESDSFVANFMQTLPVRDAMYKRNELQAQLDAAEQVEDYQRVIAVGEKLDALSRLIAQQSLSDEDCATLAGRHATLVQKLSVQCRELSTAKDWVALEPLAAKLKELKSLDISDRPGTSKPSIANIALATKQYTSNGVPIASVQVLRNDDVHLGSASVRLMLRGEFQTADGAGVTHTYRCLIKCASHAADIHPCHTKVDRLRREHAMYQELQHLSSPVDTGCVRCFSIDPAGLYMVLEDHGTDLRAVLSANPKSPQMVMEGIVSAVQALHELGIMHGDIKPENLLVKSTLHDPYAVKLCDLECARRVGEIGPAAAVGTGHYLAPEVRAAIVSPDGMLRASTAVDIFALGLVLWQVMNRSPTAALDCRSEARLNHLYSDQAQLNAHLEYPALYSAFMERVTCLDPARRSNIADLWRKIKQLSMSSAHRGLVHQCEENAYLKHAVYSKLDSMDAKLDNVLEQLKMRFDALGGNVLEIAQVVRQQSLGNGNDAHILSRIQHATENTLRRLTTASQSQRRKAPDAHAFVVQSSILELRAHIEDCVTAALNARSNVFRKDHQQTQSSLRKLSGQFTALFHDLAAELNTHMQEHRRSNADVSQQHASLRRTTASLVASVRSISDGVATIQQEFVKLRENQEAFGRQIGTALATNSALYNMVQTLITGTHSVPTLAIILPTASRSWKSVLQPMRLLRNHFRLYFMCSHTKQIASCGPKGKGYKIQVTKQWVQDAAPVLRVGLVLVKFALLASGLPLPVPDLCSVLADSTKHSKYLDIALQLVRCPLDDDLKSSEHVMQTTLDAVEAYDVNNLLTEHGVTTEANKLQLQEGSRKAYETIREVLVAQGHNVAVTCGLRQVTCSRAGTTAWVLDNDATERAWRGALPGV